MKTLITGVSTRAIAESAVKSAHDVFTIDYFGDHDQKQVVGNFSLLRDFNLPFRAENLIKASDQFEFDSVVYISNFENFPELIKKLSARAEILGNTPDTLRKVRDWKVLRKFMTENHILFPETLLPSEEERVTDKRGWLLKPTNSGGGSRIKVWEGEELSTNQIIQRYIEGTPASACFIGDGCKSVLIGLSTQLIGLDELGATDFTWCGNILPLPFDEKESHYIIDQMKNITSLITGHFNLKGACGIDFVIKRDKKGRLTPYILEINPRYTASMELVENFYGLNIYSIHINSLHGKLPDFTLKDKHNTRFSAKGILFARNDIKIKETANWKRRGIRDIPFEGDMIQKGHPVCTILVDGSGYNECRSNLFAIAERIRLETGDLQTDTGIRKAT
ncbi:MAG: ATP-grasp domain-containing protein [Desulfatiglans sp.]|jgi:predicted ATP-grasp superfamily ATP-dependent carboligase|nr:ATP-grasp domain-containing protein [Desulfatiglans sp.]